MILIHFPFYTHTHTPVRQVFFIKTCSCQVNISDSVRTFRKINLLCCNWIIRVSVTLLTTYKTGFF